MSTNHRRRVSSSSHSCSELSSIGFFNPLPLRGASLLSLSKILFALELLACIFLCKVFALSVVLRCWNKNSPSSEPVAAAHLQEMRIFPNTRCISIEVIHEIRSTRRRCYVKMDYRHGSRICRGGCC